MAQHLFDTWDLHNSVFVSEENDTDFTSY